MTYIICYRVELEKFEGGTMALYRVAAMEGYDCAAMEGYECAATEGYD